MIYVDTESIGLNGPTILIQYGLDEDDIKLHHVWLSPVRSTLSIIERIVHEGICAFNVVHDWYQLVQIYNMFYHQDPDDIPKVSHKHTADFCLKPNNVLDLMLTARSGKYQFTMGRKPILIRKVPKDAADILLDSLRDSTSKLLPSICFARAPKEHEPWEVVDGVDDFVNLRLRFFASGSLKHIVDDAGLAENTDHTGGLDAPYDPKIGWRDQLVRHVQYWKSPRALAYAANDVRYLVRLHRYLGSPPANDIDSRLAVAVACAKYHGFGLDHPKIASTKIADPEMSFNIDSPKQCLARIHELCTPLQRALIKDTSKKTLEKLESWEGPIGQLVKDITICRKNNKRRNTLAKLAKMNRYRPDFKVIGARSGRMSGGAITRDKGSLNPQGIQSDKDMRSCFTMHTLDLPYLYGGDYEAFEIAIQAAVYGSKQLDIDLRSGKKIYDLFGDALGTAAPYKRRKNAFLGWGYGAQEKKIAETLNEDIELVRQGLPTFLKKYPEIKDARDGISARFCSMSQPDGIGTEIIWRDPDEKIETLFGFPRYFTLENNICRMLYDLTKKMPSGLARLPGTVIRNKKRGPQTVLGATLSATYAACFNIQALNMRAANNHVIQGTGARINKELQASLWDLQPAGIHPWVICTFNIHDETLSITNTAETGLKTAEIAKDNVEKFSSMVPLLALTWKRMENWSDKE